VFKKIFIFASSLLWCFTSAQAQQTTAVTEPQIWHANIEEDKTNTAYGIPFLSLSNKQLQIEGSGKLHFTNISGRFRSKVIDATFNSKEITLKEDGSFELPFGFPLDAKTFTITAIDEKQKLFRAVYKIIPIDLDEKVYQPAPPPLKRLRYSAGLGLTSLSFRQKNVASFSQMAATVKASGSYRLVPDQYDLGVSAFFNLVPFSSNSPAGYKIQYLGINARIGRPIIKAPSKIRLNLNAGIYYNTSVSSIGFTNMIGPQLYPEAIYLFNNGNSLLAYAKYSPALSNSLSISFKENRELAMGFHYSFQLLQKHRVSIGLDLSQLNLNIDSDWASTNTYSLSAGYSF
jgi:hypothetical protein